MMDVWVLMVHSTEWDWDQAWGRLIGGWYEDTDSLVKAIETEFQCTVTNTKVVNDGNKILYETSDGILFGACKMRHVTK
jgi:hypothetical protein